MEVPVWIDKVIAGGPAAIFALMWFLERQRADRVQAKLDAISEKSLVLWTEWKSLLVTGKSNPT